MAMQRRGSGGSASPYRDLFDRFFDDYGEWRESSEARLPLDITASDDAVTIEAALPGVAPDDVEITLHQGTLTISVSEESRRESEGGSGGKRIYREVRRSHGSRTITLPSGLDFDQANATFEHGMLRLVLPRAEEAKPRQIKISERGSSG